MLFCSVLLLLFPENGSVGGSGGLQAPSGGRNSPAPGDWQGPCFPRSSRGASLTGGRREGAPLKGGVEAEKTYC